MRGIGHDRGQTTSHPPGIGLVVAALVAVVVMDTLFNASQASLPGADIVLPIVVGGFVSLVGGLVVNFAVVEEWADRFGLPGP